MTRPTRWARTIAAILVAIGLVASSAACASLPTKGAIKIGPSIEQGFTGEVLYYSPNGPSEGASQTDIINGFLTAGTGPQNDYEVAREYLTEDLRSNWQPTQEVLVQGTSGQLLIQPDNRVTYATAIESRINSEGQFTALSTPEPRVLEFRLVRENGEWRISKAPNATLLIRPVFEVLFKPYSVYFYDNNLKYLVPDVRWFPSRASTSTRLVNAILDGPARWLQSTVQSAIPAGTALSIDSVTVNRGVAVVDLNSEALKASPLHRQYIKAQLTETLMQVPTVTSVSLLIAGTPVVVPNFSQPQPPAESYAPVMLTEKALYQIGGTAASPIAGSSQFISELKPQDFALDSAQDRLALLTKFGIYSARLGDLAASPELIDARAGLLAPQIDPQGYIWSVGKSAGSLVYAINSRGLKLPQSASWLSGRARLAFAVSPEGSRIAFVTMRAGRPVVEVAGIVRNSKGEPSAIGVAIEVAKDVISPRALSWQGSTTLAVLGSSTAVGSSLVTQVEVGGMSKALTSVPVSKAIASSSASQGIFVLSEDSSVLNYQVIDWRKLADGALAVHYSH